MIVMNTSHKSISYTYNLLYSYNFRCMYKSLKKRPFWASSDGAWVPVKKGPLFYSGFGGIICVLDMGTFEKTVQKGPIGAKVPQKACFPFLSKMMLF